MGCRHNKELMASAKLSSALKLGGEREKKPYPVISPVQSRCAKFKV